MHVSQGDGQKATLADIGVSGTELVAYRTNAKPEAVVCSTPEEMHALNTTGDITQSLTLVNPMSAELSKAA
jgi:hypothetical protein